MRILISGWRGYISGVLMPRLQELGHTIHLFQGVIEAHRNWNDAPSGYDAVIHLAAFNDLYGCETAPLKSFYTNYFGTMLAAKYCIENKAKLIFTSTDTVTGISGMPISVYDSHKWAAEKSLLSLSELDSVTLRLSTVYGPSPAQSKQANRGIINRWCKMALAGETLKVYEGVKHCRRDYLHVSDVADAIIKAMDAPRGSYQVCTGIGTSILDMARLIAREAGAGSKVEVVPEPEKLHTIEYRTGIGDYHLMNWQTGWQPKLNIINGIAETIKYFGESS